MATLTAQFYIKANSMLDKARNTTEEKLLPFHKGAFKMAIESGHPVAVQALVNVKKISGLAAGLDFWPGKVKVVWSEPISVEGMTIKDVKGLSETVAERMTEKLISAN